MTVDVVGRKIVWIPAFAGMTIVKGMTGVLGVTAFAGMTVGVVGINLDWIPAFAGMTAFLQLQ